MDCRKDYSPIDFSLCEIIFYLCVKHKGMESGSENEWRYGTKYNFFFININSEGAVLKIDNMSFGWHDYICLDFFFFSIFPIIFLFFHRSVERWIPFALVLNSEESVLSRSAIQEYCRWSSGVTRAVKSRQDVVSDPQPPCHCLLCRRGMACHSTFW